MIGALAVAAKRLLRNPLLLLPALAAIAILLVLAYAFAPFALDLLLNAVFLEMVPDAPLYALPFQFSALYWPQIAGMLALSVLSGILFAALSYWYAAYTRAGFTGKPSIGRACRETIAVVGKIVSFVVFVLLVLLLFGILLWLFALLGLAVELLGLLLTALLALAGFYLYIKLAFSIQALALEEGTVKQALQQSWQFAVGRFWHVFVFLLVLSVINQAIVFIGSYASDLVLDDVLAIVVLAIFWAISLAFAGIAMPLYYAEKKLGKGL